MRLSLVIFQISGVIITLTKPTRFPLPIKINYPLSSASSPAVHISDQSSTDSLDYHQDQPSPDLLTSALPAGRHVFSANYILMPTNPSVRKSLLNMDDFSSDLGFDDNASYDSTLATKRTKRKPISKFGRKRNSLKMQITTIAASNIYDYSTELPLYNEFGLIEDPLLVNPISEMYETSATTSPRPLERLRSDSSFTTSIGHSGPAYSASRPAFTALHDDQEGDKAVATGAMAWAALGSPAATVFVFLFNTCGLGG